MKKSYIIPATETLRVDIQPILAGLDSTRALGSTPTNPEDFEVKTSRPSYNVWDDDWSAE